MVLGLGGDPVPSLLNQELLPGFYSLSITIISNYEEDADVVGLETPFSGVLLS